ncbi:MAG: aldo/keto reductase [Octadecabacter sp.]
MTDLTTLPRLGLGCWPLSGPFYQGDRPLGYANADPAESIAALQAAYSNGIRIFDTAAVYGAGKGERLVGQALAGKADAYIVSKIGLAFDEDTEQLIGLESDPAHVSGAIDRCLGRLKRDHIDLLFLHPNETTVEDAGPLFDEMEKARKAGKIGAFGWSTDFPDKVTAMAQRDGFTAVEYAMNVFFDAADMRGTAQQHGLASLIRSPLAMGLLSGKYGDGVKIAQADVRNADEDYNDYYQSGGANPKYLKQIDALRDLLQTGGRSLVQGALSWVMAAGPNAIPLPGARTVAQVEENARTLDFGPLPDVIMAQINDIMPHENAGPARAR